MTRIREIRQGTEIDEAYGISAFIPTISSIPRISP